MGMDIKVKPQLEVRSRLQVLYYVVREITEGFGASSQALETIKKGVLDQQVIEKIFINYLDDKGRLVGRVVIAIDWERHEVLASSSEGKEFRINSSRSVSEQISKVYQILVEHTKKLRQAFDVKEIEVRYSYTSEVWNNKSKLKEVREYLGTSPSSQREWAPTSSTQSKKWDIVMEFASWKLRELKVRIEHNKPK